MDKDSNTFTNPMEMTWKDLMPAEYRAIRTLTDGLVDHSSFAVEMSSYYGRDCFLNFVTNHALSIGLFTGNFEKELLENILIDLASHNLFFHDASIKKIDYVLAESPEPVNNSPYARGILKRESEYYSFLLRLMSLIYKSEYEEDFNPLGNNDKVAKFLSEIEPAPFDQLNTIVLSSRCKKEKEQTTKESYKIAPLQKDRDVDRESPYKNNSKLENFIIIGFLILLGGIFFYMTIEHYSTSTSQSPTDKNITQKQIEQNENSFNLGNRDNESSFKNESIGTKEQNIPLVDEIDPSLNENLNVSESSSDINGDNQIKHNNSPQVNVPLESNDLKESIVKEPQAQNIINESDNSNTNDKAQKHHVEKENTSIEDASNELPSIDSTNNIGESDIFFTQDGSVSFYGELYEFRTGEVIEYLSLNDPAFIDLADGEFVLITSFDTPQVMYSSHNYDSEGLELLYGEEPFLLHGTFEGWILGRKLSEVNPFRMGWIYAPVDVKYK